MTRMLLIPADEVQPLQVVQVSGLQDYYRLIGCDTIEACFPVGVYSKIGVTAYVDEEGLMNDKPMNDRLMRLFHNTNSGYGLRGNALVFGGADRHGDDVDVPQDVLVDCKVKRWPIQ